MDRNRVKASLSSFLPVILTVAGFGVMGLVFPYYLDDLWYVVDFKPYFLGTDRSFPLDGLLRTWANHYNGDNIRLANVALTLLMLIPRWIGASLTAVMIFLTLRMLCRLAAPRPGWIVAVWVCVLFTVGMPWENEHIVLCYMLNYVWSGTLAVWVARLLLSRRLPAVALSAALGLLAGACHEGFGAPLLAGVCSLIVLWPRRYLTRRCVALAAGIAAGLTFLLTAPGALTRGHMSEPLAAYDFIVTVLRQPLLCLFAALALLCLALPRARRRTPWRTVVFIAAVGAANFIIHLFTHFAMRIAWCGELLSIAGIVICARMLWRLVRRRKGVGPTMMALTICAAAFTAVHLVAADIWVCRLAREIKVINAACARGEADSRFFEITNEFDLPWIVLRKAPGTFFSTNFSHNALRFVYGERGRISVIDSRLRRVTPDSGVALGGIPGLRRLGNVFFAPDPDSTLYRGDQFRCGTDGGVITGGRRGERWVGVAPFISEADSCRYLQIYPGQCVGRLGPAEIEGIFLPDFH